MGREGKIPEPMKLYHEKQKCLLKELFILLEKSELQKERQSELPFMGSLPKWPPRPKLDQSKAMSHELLPNKHMGAEA